MLDKNLKLKLRFSKGLTDDFGLSLYDGATSFHGFARAIQIVTHAFMCDEAVSKATALKGCELYFESPRQGSVLFDITARFLRKPKTAPLNNDAFYDFTRVALERATGNLDIKPVTPFVEGRLKSDEPFFDALSEKLEGSLQEGHRSIDSEDVIVSLERPRSPLIQFDTKTSEWVRTRDEDPNTKDYVENMTRFNTQTGNGRAYISQIKRIVPVHKSDKFNDGNKAWLTWSLHGDNLSTAKELVFRGRKIDSASGVTKRIVLDDCYRV